MKNPKVDWQYLTSKPAWIAYLFILALIWSYWPTSEQLIEHWNSNPDNSHGWFVIPIIAVLLWHRTSAVAPKSISDTGRWDIWAGLGMLLIAGAARTLGARLYLPWFDPWTVPLSVLGVCFLLLGARRTFWAAPPICFFWFACPLPMHVELALGMPLQLAAANSAGWILQLFGQPAIVLGTTILLGDHNLEVERACAGMRMFHGVLALAIGISLWQHCSWKKMGILVLVAPLIALLVNILRIAITGLLYQFMTGAAALHFTHDQAGYFMIVAALLLFLLFEWCLDLAAKTAQNPAGRSVAWGSGLLVSTVVLVSVATYAHFIQEKRAAAKLYAQAERYEAEKNWTEAVTLFSQYIEFRPDDHLAMSRLAQAMDQIANLPDSDPNQKLRAAKAYGDAWRVNPEDYSLAFRRMKLLGEAGEIDSALSISDQLFAKAEELPEDIRKDVIRFHTELWYDELIRGRAKQRTWESLEESLRLATEWDSGFSNHWLKRAIIIRDRLTTNELGKRRDDAEKVLQKFIEKFPQDPQAEGTRAAFYIDWNENSNDQASVAEARDQAALSLNRALELCPTAGKRAAPVYLLAARQENRNLLTASQVDRKRHKQTAIVYLRQALSADPDDLRAYTMLAESLNETGDPESQREALSLLNSAHKLTGADALVLALMEANIYSQLGQHDKAKSALATFTDKLDKISEPNQTKLRLMMALSQAVLTADRQDNRQAISELESVLELPKNTAYTAELADIQGRAWEQLGALYEATGNRDRAIVVYEKAGRLNPNSVAWNIKAALANEAIGNYTAALTNLQRLAQTPEGKNSGDVYVILARILLKVESEKHLDERNLTSARQALKTALDRGATAENLAVIEAELAALAGDRAKSQSLIAEALVKNPDSPQLLFARAGFEVSESKWDQATTTAKNLADLNADPKQVNRLKLSILLKSGRLDEANQFVCERSQRMSPEDAVPIELSLASFHLQSGQIEEARGRMIKILDRYGNRLDVLRALANLDALLGRYDDLHEWESRLTKAEGPDGTHWRAAKAERLLQNRTLAQSDTRSLGEVESLVNYLMQLRPQWPTTQLLRARYLQRLGRLDESIQAYTKAWEYGGRNIRTAEELISLLNQQRRHDLASLYIRRTREMIRFSPTIFDESVKSEQSLENAEQMLGIARAWTKREPSAQNLIRLGRTLLLSVTPDTKQGPSIKAEAENAFKEAIETDPQNLVGWNELYGLYSVPSRDGQVSQEIRQSALNRIRELHAELAVTPINKDLALARFLIQLNLRNEASRLLLDCVDQFDGQTEPAMRHSVLTTSARFFQDTSKSAAERFCRQALAIESNDLEATKQLIQLLAMKDDPAALAEASRMLDARFPESQRSNPNYLQLSARILASRSRMHPPDSALRKADAEKASNILSRLSGLNNVELLELVSIYEMHESVHPAWEILTKLLSAPSYSHQTVIAATDFWKRHFKKDGQFLPVMQGVISQLERTENQRTLALQLRLEMLDPSDLEKVQLVLDQFLAPLKSNSRVEIETVTLAEQLLTAALSLNREEIYACALKTCERELGAEPAARAAALNINLRKTTPQMQRDAFKLIDSAVANTDNVGLLQTAGEAYFLHEHPKEAIELFRKLILLVPKSVPAMNNLAFALAEVDKDKSEALDVIEAARSLDPDSVDLMDSQACILLLANENLRALELLQKAQSAGLASNSFDLHLAYAMHKVGDDYRANQLVQRLQIMGLTESQLLVPSDRRWLAELHTIKATK